MWVVPVGDFYGYKSVGIFQDTTTIGSLNRAAQKATGNSTATYQTALTQPGDRRFADVNKDGVVNDEDQTDIGSPIPKFFGGLNLDATYKAFDFNLYFYGMYGNKLLNFARSDMESFANQTGPLPGSRTSAWTTTTMPGPLKTIATPMRGSRPMTMGSAAM